MITLLQWARRRFEYQSGGRGPRLVDCYGFARLVRAEWFGLSLLPAFDGVGPDDKLRAARSFGNVVADLRRCDPEPGAFVLLYTGRVATHCGACTGAGVAEIDENIAPRIVRLRRMQQKYSAMECYT